jgi:hypothetical protein
MAAREAENTSPSHRPARPRRSSPPLPRSTHHRGVDRPLGSTLNGKVEAITGGVREHTEQLAQLVDSKRSALIDAIAGKAAEISSTIGNAADSALKSIENHGGAFTVAMMNNSSDLARQINTASEIAIGAVSKSLKDIDQTSRAAIDQSRQVATSTINELQETSRSCAPTRSPVRAAGEQHPAAGSAHRRHDNLNSLERTLVTRVAGSSRR